MTYETYQEISVGDAVVFKEGRDIIRCFVETISYKDNGAEKDGLKEFGLKDISNGEVFRVTVGKKDYAYCPWRFLDGLELTEYMDNH